MRWSLLSAAVAVAALSACANLPSVGDGIVALEVTQPESLTLTEGTSVQLEAHALDSAGEEVAATISWTSPDTTLSVDSLLGIVTAVTSSGQGRVQAAVGSLRSAILTFQLAPLPATVKD